MRRFESCYPSQEEDSERKLRVLYFSRKVSIFGSVKNVGVADTPRISEPLIFLGSVKNVGVADTPRISEPLIFLKIDCIIRLLREYYTRRFLCRIKLFF
ncbi:MAG: hypothetical protein PUF60_10350, partial [Firmicutes bacterium]|nr:hypothetical protein [Bacillota bacterium]